LDSLLESAFESSQFGSRLPTVPGGFGVADSIWHELNCLYLYPSIPSPKLLASLIRSAASFQKLALSAELDTGSLSSLTESYYEKALSWYFRKQINSMPAKDSRTISPIVVHVGIVIILVGSI